MHADNLCTRFWVEGLNDVVRNFPGKNSSVKIITRIPSRLEKLFFGIIYRFMLAYHVSHFADKKRMKEKPHCQSTSNNSHIFSPILITYIYIEFLTSPFQLSEISMLTSFVAFCVASSLSFWKPNCRKNYFPFDFSWCIYLLILRKCSFRWQNTC